MMTTHIIDNVLVDVVGQYIPSEQEMMRYLGIAKDRYGDSLQRIVISCGMEYVSAYFHHNNETTLYRSVRLRKQNEQ